jgi:CBS domain-containing membrane protein
MFQSTTILGMLAIALPLHLDASDDVFMILGSFGASAALLYGAPDAPLSQPRNLVGGHVLSAVIGVAVRMFGDGIDFGVWFTAPLSVAVSISCMQATKTLHPPGAATSLIAVIGNQRVHDLGFMYVLTPTLVGSLIMLLVAVVGNNCAGTRRYPKFWW